MFVKFFSLITLLSCYVLISCLWLITAGSAHDTKVAHNETIVLMTNVQYKKIERYIQWEGGWDTLGFNHSNLSVVLKRET
jgi:predicted house-cleaning NTP pyrophosphatase (Maf/HAM1 superfamily)